MPVINRSCKESGQKLKSKSTKDKANLFQVPLELVIDPDHPLVQLSEEFAGGGIRKDIAVNFVTATEDREKTPVGCLG